MLVKKEFIKLIESDLNGKMKDLTDVEKDYIRDKTKKCINLFIELENNGFLKILNSESVEQMKQEANNILFNFDHMKKLYLEFHKLIDKHSKSGLKTITLLDENFITEYQITINQVTTIFAWIFCSLCEIIRNFIMSMIDFSKLRGREPHGLRQLEKLLEDNGINNLSIFDDIDTKVRNSFFHFDFKFKIDGDKAKVYCQNNPEIYKDYQWRDKNDKNQSDYILLQDLIKLILNGDRTAYVTTALQPYFINKSGF